MTRTNLAAFLLAGLAQPALAERLSDPASGLSVDPPSGYAVSALTPSPPTTAGFAVRWRQDPNIGCQIAFNPAPSNARFNQEQLNAEAARTGWRENALRTLGGVYIIDHDEPFRHAGIDGLLAEGMLRPREGIPAEAVASVRTLFILLETPSGRTFAVCVGEARSFAARRPDFLAIARSTTPDTRQPAAAAVKP